MAYLVVFFLQQRVIRHTAAVLSLHASSFGRTAAIVRQRCHVDDLDYLDAGAVDSTDSRLTTVARSFHVSFYFA